MDPATAGAISAGTGVVNSGGNFLSSILTNAANAKENEKTREYNLKMWNMQNEYNSPAAQMSRYKAAGLNPNLMYSQGNVGNAAPPTPGSPVRYNAPEIDLPNTLSMLNMMSQAAKTQQETTTEQWRAGLLQQQYDQLAMYNNWLYAPNEADTVKSMKQSNVVTNNAFSLYNKKLDLMNENIKNVSAGNVLRGQEAGMAGSLKSWNMTAADSIYARLLKKAWDGISNLPIFHQGK